MKAFVVFNPASGDARWLTHGTPPLSVPAGLAVAEFVNVTYGEIENVPVVVDLATLTARENDLPLIELRRAPAGHTIHPTPQEG